uniref:Uncharacterized protein n=1 Tax=Guillardia theta TaxID=55529 RepID=A0A7S4NT78_GUITH|mmetsp:Transcript_31412/g.100652  ORF Transcript_31412/g.100652 Transcript_31412/m.100652 type:complete len:130 (+) Transcript_31412:402-791(+)
MSVGIAAPSVQPPQSQRSSAFIFAPETCGIKLATLSLSDSQQVNLSRPCIASKDHREQRAQKRIRRSEGIASPPCISLPMNFSFEISAHNHAKKRKGNDGLLLQSLCDVARKERERKASLSHLKSLSMQ